MGTPPELIAVVISTLVFAEGVAQVVACLPSKHKALSSNPTTTKKNKL
jgi:hypothetical protein